MAYSYPIGGIGGGMGTQKWTSAPFQPGGSGMAGMPSGVSALAGYGQGMSNTYAGMVAANPQSFVANQNAINAGNQIQGSVSQNPTWANSIMESAMDPEQALFNQQMQMLTDQTRAGQAARGIAMSPYGAGIEAYEQGLFTNDWRDRQLQRMATGAGAAQGLQGQYASSMEGGANLNMAGYAAPITNMAQMAQGSASIGNTLAQGASSQIDYLNFLAALGKMNEGPFAAPWFQVGGGQVTDISPYPHA